MKGKQKNGCTPFPYPTRLIMRNFTRYYLLLILSLSVVAAHAIEVTIDDCRYILRENGHTATIIGKYNRNDVVTIIIPPYISYEGVNYTVTSIGDEAFYDTNIKGVEIPNTVTYIGKNAFKDCWFLSSSVEIPNSVTFIGESAFEGCWRLPSVELPNSITTIANSIFKDCSSLASVVIPNTVTTIGNSAFYDCGSLTSIEIPNSVTTIGNFAFWSCNGLTSIDLPNSVITIGACAFSHCTSLASIEIPNSVTFIGECAFTGCTGLTSIKIPNSVTTIGNFAFEDCTSLTSIRIPSSVKKLGYGLIIGCNNLSEIIFLCYCEYDDWLNSNTPHHIDVYAYRSIIEQIKEIHEDDFNYLEIPIAISRSEDLEDVSFGNGTSVNGHEIKVNKVAAIAKNGEAPETTIYPDESGTYKVATSWLDETVYFTVYFDFDGIEERYDFSMKSKPKLLSFDYEPHQTYAVFNVSVSSGKTIHPSEFGVANHELHWYPVGSDDIENGDGVKKGSVKVSFNYRDDYNWRVYAVYDGKTYYGNVKPVYLKGIDPTFQYNTITPTTIKCVGRQTIEDATLEREYFTVGNKEYEGSDITITGLKPNTSYDIAYHVVTAERGDERSERLEFRTQNLEFSILRPKCVSSTCAIVAAETNISEDEPNVGFQWRKYDAPETLPSNEGYAAIYDGRLEGYVKNLQPTSYYNVRAFYKAADDTYYYSDWITFDPSDFSYFEPTVHTYPIDEVTDSKAKVRGYALAGTDEITEQGFEYWALGGDQSKAMRVKAAPGDGGDVSVVIATGQVMTAELTNLAPSTTYCCRAFVTTTGGTSYGEEQTFTTMAGPTGIYSAETEKAEPTITGYYDLGGRKLSEPTHGAVTIVRYSDGSARKVLIK